MTFNPFSRGEVVKIKKSANITLDEYNLLPEELKTKWTLITRSWRGGPNMPKHQPCPECGGRAKRGAKTSDGASYHCKRCSFTNYVSSKVKVPLIAAGGR